MRRRLRAILVCGLLAAGGLAGATERLAFRLDLRSGLPASRVLALAQDSRGFVWIGTQAGLARFDGVEVRPWASETLPRIDLLAAGPGSLVGGWRGETLHEIVDGGARVLPGPDGEPIGRCDDAAFDETGRLWVATGGRVVSRSTDGVWDEWPADAFEGEAPRRIDLSAAGVHLLTAGGIWRLDGERAVRLAAIPGLNAFEARDDGTVWAAEFCCRVFEVPPGEQPRERFDATGRSPLRAISMVERDGAVWLSYDQLLVAFRSDGRVELLDARDGVRGGGPLLVDDEGSLWLGTNLGVVRYPEPDTVTWTPDDGLPRSFRHLARSEGRVWVTGWDGVGELKLEDARPVASRALDLMATYPMCLDDGGRLWGGGLLEPYGPGRRNAVVERVEGRFRTHDAPELGSDLSIFACATARDGTVWTSLSGRLGRTRPDGGRPTPLTDLRRTAGDAGIVPRDLLEDATGTLWTTDAVRVCRAPASGTRRDAPAPWDCERPEDAGEIFAVHEAAPGEIWIATRDAGVLARTRDGWRAPLPGDSLPGDWVQALAPARDGVWILGDGFVLRADRNENAWSVVERLGSWNGLPVLQARDAVEDADGTLWLATYAGVVRIPPSARRGQPAPPRVERVAALADGEPLTASGTVDLPYSRNRVELRHAALSFRDRSRVRYRVRHRPEAPWSVTRDATLRFVDLAPGRYRVEVQASLDGRTWSARPASFAFRVRPPWYRQAWFLVLAAVLAASSLYVAFRLRVAYLVGIERERSRIAMDLHDDMGSKLGSIGILADLASGEGVDEPRRRALAARVADMAGEVGGSLADIVWALRPGSRNLEALAAHLAERGDELLAPRGIELRTVFPDRWPDIRLGLGVRRHVQLIGLEALHNAARHSGAAFVRLALAPEGANRWRLRVENDGPRPDAPTEATRSTGLGLESMQRRAELVGADLNWARLDDGGWRVELVFDPHAEDRRLVRRRRLPRPWGSRGDAEGGE